MCGLTTKQEYVQIQNDIKLVRTLKLFVIFFLVFVLFYQPQYRLLESMAAIFLQYAGYV